MRTAADCTLRADECRKLAKIAARPEDWAHFLEMAETWDLLAKQRQQELELTKTFALAESIANDRLSKFAFGHEEAA